MSLKAKLEAVIYAAEEPVTLAQLTALFSADALEWKAAQEAAAAEQTAEVAGQNLRAVEPAEPLPLLTGELEYLGLADTPDVYAGGSAEPGQEAQQPQAETAGGGDGRPEAGSAATEAHAGSAERSEELGGAIALGEPYQSVSLELDQPVGLTEAAAEGSAIDAGSGVGPAARVASAPIDIEVEAKRLARLRDREVKGVLKHLLDELVASSAADNRGVEIREIAGGYRMATKPECHDAVRLFVKSLKPAMKLSLPALETLAVVAYKQPVTAPEVAEIRGVESAGVLGSLLARKLIATAGRKQVIGRPILYKTTREFLLRFGLRDVSELPSMEEFEKMAAIELEETEPSSDGSYEAAGMQPDEAVDTGAEGYDEERLESNSPSGEELAQAAEANEGDPDAETQEAAATTKNDETDGALAGSAAPGADGVIQPASPIDSQEAAPAEPEEPEQAETGAVSHAQEDPQDR